MGSIEVRFGDIVQKPNGGQHVITRVSPGISSMSLEDGEICGLPSSPRGPLERVGAMALDAVHSGMVSAMSAVYENEARAAELLERLQEQSAHGPVPYSW